MEFNLQRERRKKQQRVIQDRIKELISWLHENNASCAEWDVNVRELHSYEMKLEMMDQRGYRKTNSVDYGVSLMPSVQLQY